MLNRPAQLAILRRMGRQNPIRQDPTKTSLIRGAFRKEINRRFSAFRGNLVNYMLTNSAILFTLGVDIPADPWTPRIGMSDADLLEEFMSWYKEAVKADIAPNSEEDWIYPYMLLAYDKGAQNAYVALNGDESLDVAFPIYYGSPIVQETRKNTVATLLSRTNWGLYAITTAIGGILLDQFGRALLSKMDLKELAKQMDETVKAQQIKRANALVESEIVRIHAEAQLDTFQANGVKDLRLLVEWTTAGDNKVCPLCEARAGTVYTIEKARGLIPYHPNCRCSWTPV